MRPPSDNITSLDDEISEELLRIATTEAPRCDLSRLHLVRLPQELRWFTWVRELMLQGNKLTSASFTHDFFHSLPMLEVLDLSENHIVQPLPRSIWTLRCLWRLLLDHSEIEDLFGNLADVVVYLPSLVQVGLEWNRLTEFPTPLLTTACCPKLETIFLAENCCLTCLPPLRDRPDVVTTRLTLTVSNSPVMRSVVANSPAFYREAPPSWSLSSSYTAGQEAAAEAAASNVPPPLCWIHWVPTYPDALSDCPLIFIGSMRSAQSAEVFKDLGIQDVLTTAPNLTVTLPPGVRHLELVIKDDMLPFEPAIAFIQRAVAQGRAILVHDFAGICRSVVVVAAFMIRTRGMSADAALASIKRSRKQANPTGGFLLQLAEFEQSEKARK